MKGKLLLIAGAIVVVVAIIYLLRRNDTESYYVLGTCLYAMDKVKHLAHTTSGDMLQWWMEFLQKTDLDEPDTMDNAQLTTALQHVRKLSSEKLNRDYLEAHELYKELLGAVRQVVAIMRNQTSGVMMLHNGQYHEDMMTWYHYQNKMKELKKVLINGSFARGQCLPLNINLGI